MSSSDPVKPVHILFVGAGAVGCFYASRLHHPAHNIHVSLTARSNYDIIASSGVTLQTHTPGATHPSGAATPDDWDYVVVATKALPDRTDDAALIAPLVSAGTCIVLIQNGVGVEEPYRTRFPQNPILSAVTVISAEQIQQGTIRQNRWTRISIGPFGKGLVGASDSESNSESGPQMNDVMKMGEDCMSNLAQWWQVHGQIQDVKTHSELELQTIRWHKLCINSAFNPSALREHITGIMQEIWDAAPKVLGQPLPDDLGTPERIIRSTERNAGAKPSMLLDWEAGRPMELEVILGNPIKIAKKAGVEMPRLQSVYALLRSMQTQRDVTNSKTRL
ncbi:hypothetical protein PG997_012737 [Apiospora hydei]|uniref:2-dehydropantoate 2-reductase n=1 Tax=Apiospora hydei TaxID=1337664 RepID=A0ABR1V6W5_9PEZI